MKLPANHWKPAGHGFILTNSCMYQMQRNDTNNWKTIQYVGGTPSFRYVMEYPIYLEKESIYMLLTILIKYGKLILNFLEQSY